MRLDDFTSSRVEEFLVTRRIAGYTQWCSTKGVTPLLTYLRALKIVPEPTVAPRTPSEASLDAFSTYLLQERGLVTRTAASYVSVARLMLDENVDPEEMLEHLDTSDVMRFVTQQCQVRNASYVACGLRSFLNYCHLRGLIPSSLGGVIPNVASWRLAPLPTGPSFDQVHSLLASCDRGTTTGTRDFAVLTLLARLGQRAGEVAAMQLGARDLETERPMIVPLGLRRGLAEIPDSTPPPQR